MRRGFLMCWRLESGMAENPYRAPGSNQNAQDDSDGRAPTVPVWHIIVWALAILPMLVLAAVAILSTI